MTDVSAELLVEPAAGQEQAVKRSLSAPHLSSGLVGAVEVLKAASDRQHPAMVSVTQTLVQARREPVNVSLQGARQGHVCPKRGVSLRKRTITARSRRRLSKGGEKVAPIHENTGEDRCALPRSRSLDHVTSGPADASLADRVSLRPWSSLPLLLGLEQYTAQWGGVPVDLALRERVQNVRVTGSDELVPPDSSGDGQKELHSPASQCTPEALHRLRERELFLHEIWALGKAELSLTSDTGVTDSDLDHEVAWLTQSMAKQQRANAFNLCRRGALYKKRGHLDLAMEDLNQAISLESLLLDAYWHRHSIHLLKRNLTQALADLNFIIKHNNKHADAFRSRAEIYRMKGDTAMAIANYSQAIKFKPQDDDLYFRRAELYEKSSETLLAMEDYAKTFAINPRRSDALLIRGLQHFHASSWEVAFTDFSLLLQLEPRSARARQYRGRIYAKLGMFQEAVADLSLAVQLDPNNWSSYYLRGCLLRKKQPEAALRDLSVSVLINNSTENLRAFLHRGLLYVGLKQWKPAASDFKSVIKLDRSVVLAHMNLGLIYMLQMDRNYEAIRVFTCALNTRPTHIQGYICRAQAFHNVKDFKRAVNDLSRTIHMKPDDQLLYIMRGQYLCDMERFDLASFYIHYAAQMDKAFPAVWESSLVQQAAIQAFLGNDSKVINQLQAATNTPPSLHGLLLLGKTQMKTQKFSEAVESFRKALTLLIPDPEAAEVFYNIGLCYVAQDNLSQALDAFNGAVKINPNLADAYHQRGLCRMRLGQPESVQDFNRALAVDPSCFQVYLSRAAFYEDQGRFAKAILNCTKAIQVQPKSVRAYLQRGTLKFCRRMYSGAVEDFTSAIQTDDTCSFAYYNRGVCYHHMKQHKLALRDYGIVLLLANGKEIDLKVLINRALLHVELNDCHNALQDLKTASGKCPEDPAIFHALGVLHHRLGNLQDSVGTYSEAVRLKPLFPEAYIGRGNTLMDYGHAEADKRAQRDFLAALHLNPLSPAARVSLGYNLQDFGSFQSAWNQFTVAIDLEPGCWEAFEGRALVNLRMKNSYGAFHDINTALKHYPLSDLLHTNRGVIRQFLGDRASAMKDYQKAISLNPDCAPAFFNAANLYFYNRQFEQACQFYTRALELGSSDDSALLNRAIAHAMLQRIPEALQDFSMALGINPLNSHIFFNRANVYCSLNRYHLAEKDLTQALQLLPNDALIYKLRADIRGHLGLTELAISDYKMALQLQEAEENGCSISPGGTIKF
nr:tetratricopeptide repeat protein 6 isoform X1 [Paramormyrops kingsleyae]